MGRPLAVTAAVALLVVGCQADQWLTPAQPVAAQAHEPSTLARAQEPDADAPAAESTRPSDEAQGKVIIRIRALVNGEPILDDEIRETIFPYLIQLGQLPEPEQTQRKIEVWRRELDRLIEREVIISEAMHKLKSRPQIIAKLKEVAEKEFDRQLRARKLAAGIQNDDELRMMLEAQGLSVVNLRRNVERSFMAMEYMRSRIFPLLEKIGHKEIRQYYDEHPGEFMAEDRVKWQHIFIDASRFPDRQTAKRFAEELAQRARQPDEDFGRLALQFDQGDSSYRNGLGYGQRRGEIKPVELEATLFQMRPDDVGPVMELSNGFHVIRVLEREFAGQLPFDEKIQDEILRKLKGIIADREYKRIVNELKRRATIQVIEIDS